MLEKYQTTDRLRRLTPIRKGT